MTAWLCLLLLPTQSAPTAEPPSARPTETQSIETQSIETQAAADSDATIDKGVLLLDGTLDHWAEASYGGQGLVEFVPAEDTEGADLQPVLHVGSGDPLTGVKWTGRIEGDTSHPENAPGTETTSGTKSTSNTKDISNTGPDPDRVDDQTPILPRTNYRLTWQARRTLGSDFFSTVLFPVGEDVCSVVVGGWGGGVIGLSSLDGVDAVENSTTEFMRFEKDRWYDFVLEVRPHTVLFKIDGTEMFEIDPTEYQVTTRVEMEPLGSFGLATFQTSGEFRNLRLYRLKAPQD